MKLIAKGIGVSKGQVQGRVKIIKSLDDHAKLKKGDILVTRLTDPTMTAIMGRAAGIICDIGGLTSHPSVLSREMGIPCIVSAKGVITGKPVTEILKDRQEIKMNGENGEIFLKDESWNLRWK
ncbi:hypothetical protein HYU07_07625 [Candidatus Woesearchaeota archaeon]|nr:hypothetical protein [Candidatus Woesearchaeota archaeon]